MKVPQIVSNLDKALDAVKSLKSTKIGGLITYLNLNGLPINENSAMALANQLLDDKLITINSDNEIIPTIKAYLGNGYIKDFTKARYIERRSGWEDVILSYGTGGAGIYGCFEISKWFAHHVHWHLPF